MPKGIIITLFLQSMEMVTAIVTMSLKMEPSGSLITAAKRYTDMISVSRCLAHWAVQRLQMIILAEISTAAGLMRDKPLHFFWKNTMRLMCGRRPFLLKRS